MFSMNDVDAVFVPSVMVMETLYWPACAYWCVGNCMFAPAPSPNVQVNSTGAPVRQPVYVTQ